MHVRASCEGRLSSGVQRVLQQDAAVHCKGSHSDIWVTQRVGARHVLAAEQAAPAISLLQQGGNLLPDGVGLVCECVMCCKATPDKVRQ